ncbi:MAG TPA: hypothetical protein DIT04_07975, partial [Dysgonomonas sp.]|nr:hypothetical protein [Dysgonomonas sp.]
MKRGHINITENNKQEFIVEAKLINGTLWLSKWQMATLFNVYTKTIESNLKAIFKAGLLRENEVSHTVRHINNGHESEEIIYNLETIIFVGFRIASFEAKAFREWVIKAFSEYVKNENIKKYDVIVVFDSKLKTPIITSLGSEER